MDANSPLIRQVQDTGSLQPKVVRLYASLFTLDPTDDEHEAVSTEGFWRELFLHKPAKQQLNDVLEPLTGSDLLNLQQQTRKFFRRAVTEASSGISPRNENALENLAAFMASVLSKRYMNPSTDVIEVLAGLDHIDKAMSDLVNGIEAIVRQSASDTFRSKAVDTALATVSGSYQTSLVTYFIHKDFFPALMKYAQDSPATASHVLPLLGLLANYNRFEAPNVYQNRMEDFVNEETITVLINNFSSTCSQIRGSYTKIQDDTPLQWSLGSTLSYVGLRALTPEAKKPPPPTDEEAKALFGALPPPETTALLASYSFIQANNLFALQLATNAPSDSNTKCPFETYLSTASYISHHAHRSERAENYALLALLILRCLIEDNVLVKRLSSPTHNLTVRLARQRAPHLPYISSPRPPAAIILDILVSTLSHNLRKRLPLPLYATTLNTLHALLVHLNATKTRLPYHWSYLWLSLVTFLRFLTTYTNDLQSAHRLSQLQSQICTPLASILTFSLLRGESFLPDPASYDDLFYKLIEVSSSSSATSNGETLSTPTSIGISRHSILSRFTQIYTSALPASHALCRTTTALKTISDHYHELLADPVSKKSVTSKTLTKIIREGYESLPDVEAADVRNGAGPRSNVDFGTIEKWREASWKAEMKKVVRVVVEDARLLSLRDK